MSEFLNEFGIEVVKAVITLFVVIDPIGIILFASYTEKMQTKDRKSVSQTATITAVSIAFRICNSRYTDFRHFGYRDI